MSRPTTCSSALIIALTGWAWGARVLRAQTLSLRNRDFVEAARLSGERTWRIIVFEIMPNLIADHRVVASCSPCMYAIGTYVALAFLGVIDAGALELGHDPVLGQTARRS